jgi:hypothetical protein
MASSSYKLLRSSEALAYAALALSLTTFANKTFLAAYSIASCALSILFLFRAVKTAL